MQFFQSDNFFAGTILGFTFPLLAFVLTRWTDWAMAIGNKPLSLYVIAALLNLLLVRYFYRQGKDNAARGIIFITFIGVLLLIFVKGVRI